MLIHSWLLKKNTLFLSIQLYHEQFKDPVALSRATVSHIQGKSLALLEGDKKDLKVAAGKKTPEQIVELKAQESPPLHLM